MSEDQLRAILEGGPHIVVELISGMVKIGSFQDIATKQKWVGAAQFAALDLQAIWAKFDRLAPHRPVFTLPEISVMASENSPTVNAWIKDGVVVPSVRNREGRGTAMLFSRDDAFVVCVIASFKRKCGLRNETLRKVARALGNGPSELILGKKVRRKKAKRRAGR